MTIATRRLVRALGGIRVRQEALMITLTATTINSSSSFSSSSLSANQINSASALIDMTTPFFVAGVSIGSSSVAIASTSAFATSSAFLPSSTTALGANTTLLAANATTLGANTTTATFVDTDDGVVLVSGTVPTGINPFTAGSGFFVNTGTLTVTTNTIAGTPLAQDFHIHGNVFIGTSLNDVLNIQPGEVAFGGVGNDTISVVSQGAIGAVSDRAFAFGGGGNDTIIDFSTRDTPIPLIAIGGSGDDTFIVAAVAPSGTTFTGGDGHDLFHFSTVPTHSANVTITDFDSHDGIVIDQSPLFPATVTFTNLGNATNVDALAAGGFVHLTLVGSFDQSQFHVATDAQNHAVITYGNSDFVLS